jgi:orotidine-5'-phosphate decarboxylase
LVPGFGAQGGTAADVKPCFNKDGLGALIASSREIIFAWQKEGNEKDYGSAARKAVVRMRKELAA